MSASILYTKDNAGCVGDPAQDGRADAAHTEGKPEEQPGDHPYSSGHQFLARTTRIAGKAEAKH